MYEWPTNTSLYEVAKKLEHLGFWKKFMNPEEVDVIRASLNSEETWNSFIELENCCIKRNGQLVSKSFRELVALRVRAFLFDQWVPLLFPNGVFFNGTVIGRELTGSDMRGFMTDEVYDTLEDEIPLYTSIQTQLVRF